MQRFLIDGNNLIHKIPEIKKLNKDIATEKLIFLLQRYFVNKKVQVTIFFDGHSATDIRTNFEIVYSLNRKADELIKQRIDRSVRNKNLIVVSSDLEIIRYAGICGCTSITSEEFYKRINSSTPINLDEKPSRANIEEFKKLFNVN